MTCKICGGGSANIFRRTILAHIDVDYFQCSSCGFIQTEEPTWLEEAYRNPINAEDTGLLKRNVLAAKRTSSILYFMFDSHGRFLDYGGGYGLFVRLMRDYGFDFYWHDPITKNLFARGFEYDPTTSGTIELVTSMECFEHFVNPVAELEQMLAVSKSILFSTETFSRGTPDPDVWEYYAFSHGQHVALYSLESLRVLARKYGMNLCTNRKSFHLMTPKSLNNVAFNVILKLSAAGLPLLIPLVTGSKTKGDMRTLAKNGVDIRKSTS